MNGVREHLVTHEISIGDYVLSGGNWQRWDGSEYNCQALARFSRFTGISNIRIATPTLTGIPAIYPSSGIPQLAVPEVLLSGIMPKLPNGEKINQ